MKKNETKGWRWPDYPDKFSYKIKDVVEKIPSQSITPLNKRGAFIVKAALLSDWDMQIK